MQGCVLQLVLYVSYSWQSMLAVGNLLHILLRGTSNPLALGMALQPAAMAAWETSTAPFPHSKQGRTGS